MAFSEVREYMPGDPIRSIDWNVTARFNQPYVKVFEEERELVMMLIIDISASEDFGSRDRQKRELLTEVAAVLAFAALQNNDKIGVILFSDHIEKFIPPKKGKSHILRIIREMIDFEPQGTGTDINGALTYFNNVSKKRSIAFLITDFMDEDYEKPLSIANRKHDMVALHLQDQAENDLPNLGLAPLLDRETKTLRWVDTGDKKVRREFKASRLKHLAETRELLKRTGVDIAVLDTAKSYITPLMNMFKQRESRR